MSDFVHLHVHTEYSLLDGSAKIKELIEETKNLGMDSIAITDHGVMFGVINFYKEAKKQGIKPIIGCEVYVAPKSRFDKEHSLEGRYYHVILLAENQEGYKNLMKLSSLGFIDGYYYKPRVDIELLKKYNKGLIALSGCLSGPVARNILDRNPEEARRQAKTYQEIFGVDNFYLEIQDHGLNDQQTVNKEMVKIAEELELPLVATNDIHFIYEEDAEAHDVLICIQTNKTIHDEDRMKYEGGQFYLKSPKAMKELFKAYPEATANTVKIANRCHVEIEFGIPKFPTYQSEIDENPQDLLRKITQGGLSKKYGEITDALKERMDYELSIIHNMNFDEYFLVTWDFVNYAKKQNIAVGPGRGSAAGSLVSYALGITNVDPIHYGLIFERFLNPERISLPDIDIDYCYERREEVVEYVINRYGQDHVANIIAFNSMKAKGAIRDVGRALGMAYSEVDIVAKMIPDSVGMTIDWALDSNPELLKLMNSDPDVKNLIHMAKRLEGLPRNASTHAAGVVISGAPIMEDVPLNTSDGVVTTQYDMNMLEDLGLLKFDFLGLRTLTVIQKALDEIERIHGEAIDLECIDLTDKKVFDMISRGDTNGIFQLEQTGMTNFMMELHPGSIDDLIAGISLYRPGPMDFIPKYIKGKKDPSSITYTHESLEPILKSTYGCIVYQEQVMEIVRELAGYSWGRSDLVRRAMSKKETNVMEEERKNFIFGIEGEVKGCIANGVPEKSASKIFDEMADFAKYAFNKSHAAAYALIAYQTGFLKVHYPVIYMAALMSSVMGSESKISEYMLACKKMEVVVENPSINHSFQGFTVNEGKVVYGLHALKNVGSNTTKAIVEERKQGDFLSLSDFLERIDSKFLNKRCVESLIKAGAFDELGGKRRQYMMVYPLIMDSAALIRRNNLKGQQSLFDFLEIKEGKLDDLPDVEEYSKSDLLKFEKEVLGVYISGHPLEAYEESLREVSANSLEFQLEDHQLRDNQPLVIGGLLRNISVKYTRKNDPMAFVTVEDLYGFVEVIVFPNVYQQVARDLIKDRAVLIKGRASIREDEAPSLICNELKFIESDMERKNMEGEETADNEQSLKILWLKIPEKQQMPAKKIHDLLEKYPGRSPVIIFNEQTAERTNVPKHFWVDCLNERLILEMENLLGLESVVVTARENTNKNADR